jgi:SAM-dependent MidA family methyltransferase
MHSTTLAGIIKQKIENEGPLCFRDFMEMALYYPDLGYYSSTREKIGKTGDFYTSPFLSPAFGAMLAKQLEEMYTLLEEDDFTVVEYGAGTGLLCKHILESLKQNEELYRKINYCIIEKSPSMREKAKTCVPEKIVWCDSIYDLSGISGCILSNELVDNLSVHQVVMQEELMEVFIDYQDGFVEQLKPARQELKNYLTELKVNLPKGFRTEINLDALGWIKETAECLKKGYVMTIDYGYPSAELYSASRNKGTLMCYHNHMTNRHPYLNIGEQDITSHVNFSALCLWGYKNGLELCGYTNQGTFLLSLGFRDYMKMVREQDSDLLKYEKEAMLSHLLLEDMGNKFKVLIQQKDTQKHELMGLKVPTGTVFST